MRAHKGGAIRKNSYHSQSFLPFLGGCVAIPTSGAGVLPIGILYTGVTGPLSATAAGVGTKEGRSCATGILGLIAVGDASVAEAARAGGITRIATVSYEVTSILGIYTSICAVVTGD